MGNYVSREGLLQRAAKLGVTVEVSVFPASGEDPVPQPYADLKEETLDRARGGSVNVAGKSGGKPVGLSEVVRNVPGSPLMMVHFVETVHRALDRCECGDFTAGSTWSAAGG
jgi:hypothetical protein